MARERLMIDGKTYYKDHFDALKEMIISPDYHTFLKLPDNKAARIKQLIFKILFFVCLFIFINLFFMFVLTKQSEEMVKVKIIFLYVSLLVLLLSIVFLILFLIDKHKTSLLFNKFDNGDFIVCLLKNGNAVLPTCIQCLEAAKTRFIKSRVFEEKTKHERDIGTGFDLKHLENKPSVINNMSGEEFEIYCCSVLKWLGHDSIRTTKTNGDQGVDIISNYHGIKCATQCKRYSGPLGNSPIQEVYAGAAYYGATKCFVMTNSTFTTGAIELAKKTKVELIDGYRLQRIVESINNEKSRYAHERLTRVFDETKCISKYDVMFDRLSLDEKEDYFFVSNIFIIGQKIKHDENFYIEKTSTFINSYKM